MDRIQRVLAFTGVALAATASLVLVPPAPAHAALPTCNDSSEADPAPGQAAEPPAEQSLIYRVAPDGRSLHVRLPPRTDVAFNVFLENTRSGDEFAWLCGGTNTEADYVIEMWRLRDDQPDLIITGVSRFMVDHLPRHDEL